MIKAFLRHDVKIEKPAKSNFKLKRELPFQKLGLKSQSEFSTQAASSDQYSTIPVKRNKKGVFYDRVPMLRVTLGMEKAARDIERKKKEEQRQL